MDVIGDLLYAAGCVAVLGVFYFAWLLTFGTSKYRRWAKEGKEN